MPIIIRPSLLRQDSKTQAEKWPGKLFDPDALKAYTPEESGEKKGVYEDQVATFKADTLDELAKKLGITDAAAFKKSVERYNALAAEGKDEDFGKEGKWLTTIDTPPFYGIHRKVRVSAIVSGVHVGEHMEVLKADSTEPIKGLYAIGNTAGDSTAALITRCGCLVCLSAVRIPRATSWANTSRTFKREGRTARIYDIPCRLSVSPSLASAEA